MPEPPSTRRAPAPWRDPALYWSVRRELWENRSIYVAPLAAAAVVLFGFVDQHDHACPAACGPCSALDPAQQHAAVAMPLQHGRRS